MTTIIRRVMGSSLFIAVVFVALAAFLPLVVHGSAEFMGKDVSSIASGIVSFYPWAAMTEAAKLLLFAFLGAFLLTVIYRSVSRHVTKAWCRWLVFPMAPLLAYISWLAASILKYPALYEASLTHGLRHKIYAAAFVISPFHLNSLAAFFLAAPFIWGFLTLGKRRALGLVLIAVGLGGGFGFYRVWPYLQLYIAKGDLRLGSMPNVIFIGVDSLRYDRLASLRTTPEIHQLLDDPQSVSFDDHFVGVPRTFPSWIEILQGKNAPETGVRHMFPGFKQRLDEFSGMVTAFRASEYDTQVVADFAGDIFPRFRAGFNKIDAPNLTLAAMIRMNTDQMMPLLLPLTTSDAFTEFFPDLKESPAFADPKQLTDKAIQALVNQDEGKPLFLTLFYSTAHFPYAAPYPFYRAFNNKDYQGKFLFQKNPEMKAGAEGVGDTDVAQVRGLYDGAVSSVDAELGRLFRLLKRLGQWEKTIIVVTADHGEDLYEPGFLQGHGEHLRGDNVLHVPFILKLAGQQPAVKNIKATSRSIDIAATVVAAAGLPHEIESSFNLMPWVKGEKTDDPRLAAYSETGIWFSRSGDGFYQKKRLDYPGISGLLNFDQGMSGEVVLSPVFEKMLIGSRHRSLIEGDYKLIYMPTPMGVEYELFNRRTDPANTKNLMGEQEAVGLAMKEHLLSLVKKMEHGHASFYEDFVVTE